MIKLVRITTSGGVAGMKLPVMELAGESATAKVPYLEQKLKELSTRGVLGSKPPLWADAQEVTIEIITDEGRVRYEIEESSASPEALQLVDALRT